MVKLVLIMQSSGQDLVSFKMMMSYFIKANDVFCLPRTNAFFQITMAPLEKIINVILFVILFLPIVLLYGLIFRWEESM